MQLLGDLACQQEGGRRNPAWRPAVVHGERGWVSPWVFHAMVALEEKGLRYRLELPPLPLPDDVRTRLRALTGVGKVPVLEHGDVAIGESLAISEYLAETFPTPAHPRIFPADLAERARARSVMSYLRTSLGALRELRPTTTVFGAPTDRALSTEARIAIRPSGNRPRLRMMSIFSPVERRA